MEGLKAALETTKQVITLSTGVITLTITFLEKIVPPTAGSHRGIPLSLKVGWICFGMATLFAVWTLMAITGSLNALDCEARKVTLSEAQGQAVAKLADAGNVRVPALLMLLSFAVGISLTIVTGYYL